MIPDNLTDTNGGSACPHTRGDDPFNAVGELCEGALVPTRVGMILSAISLRFVGFACPHTRGDDPRSFFIKVNFIFLSPHAWG